MTARQGNFIGFAVCAGLLAFAYYLQYFEYQDPCPLCLLQRGVYYVMAAVFLAAALHGPGAVGASLYSGLIVASAGFGAVIAGRQVWLQHLPADQVPACGPGLDYILERFPLGEALQRVFAGSGECAESGWSFLGLTIAGWSLVWFVLLGLFAVANAVIAFKRARAPR
jgi:protein dithiol:quinone oxidoreductase